MPIIPRDYSREKLGGPHQLEVPQPITVSGGGEIAQALGNVGQALGSAAHVMAQRAAEQKEEKDQAAALEAYTAYQDDLRTQYQAVQTQEGVEAEGGYLDFEAYSGEKIGEFLEGGILTNSRQKNLFQAKAIGYRDWVLERVSVWEAAQHQVRQSNALAGHLASKNQDALELAATGSPEEMAALLQDTAETIRDMYPGQDKTGLILQSMDGLMRTYLGNVADTRPEAFQEAAQDLQFAFLGAMNPDKARAARIFESNPDNPLAQKLLQEHSQNAANPGQSPGTDLSTGHKEGRFFVFRTPPDPDPGQPPVTREQALEQALETGEAIAFASQEEAQWFAQNHARLWDDTFHSGVLPPQAMGGLRAWAQAREGASQAGADKALLEQLAGSLEQITQALAQPTRAKALQQQAVLKEETLRLANDALEQARLTGQASQDMGENVANVLGPEQAREFENDLQTNLEFYRLDRKILSASQQDMPRIMEDLHATQALEKNKAQALEKIQYAQALQAKVAQGRADDPALFAQLSLDKPQATLQEVVAEQRRLGIPENRIAVLPNSQAREQAQALASLQGAPLLEELNKTMHGLGPEYWDTALQDMAREGLPPTVLLLGKMNTTGLVFLRKAMAEGLATGRESFQSTLPPGEAARVQDLVREALRDYTLSVTGAVIDHNRSAMAAHITEACELAAMQLVQQGKPPGQAAQYVANTLFNDSFHYNTYNHGVYRLPRSLDKGIIQEGALAAARFTRDDPIAVPGSAEGNAARVEQEYYKGFTKAQYIEMLNANGQWITNEDETGIILLNQTGEPVRLDSGQRYEVFFVDIENALQARRQGGKSATKAATPAPILAKIQTRFQGAAPWSPYQNRNNPWAQQQINDAAFSKALGIRPAP